MPQTLSLTAETGRLLNVRQAATYLGLSAWTIRDLIASGYLARIMLPSSRNHGEPTRRVLVDRLDLDALIERFRETAPPYPTEERTHGLREHFTQRGQTGAQKGRANSTRPATQPVRAEEPTPLPPVGKAPHVPSTDIRQPVDLQREQDEYWCRAFRNGVDTKGLFRCCLWQLLHYERERGPHVANGTQVTCPYCQTAMVFRRSSWESAATPEPVRRRRRS